MEIQWREWSTNAFVQAEAESKPILLSLVTAWSDGCAVMDRTTYADPTVVSLVQARAVPVRVDADRHPDIGERYGLGGWPTTAFLTSSAEILSGGTYLEPDQLISMLRQVDAAYRTHATEIASRSRARDAPRSVRLQPDGQPPDFAPERAVEDFRALLIERFDPVNGGLGSAPKLPHAHALLFALSLVRESADTDLLQLVTVTLKGMSGLWDAAAGGFCRYAAGEDWSRSVIEKTLEENAALLHVHVDAAITTGSSSARETAADVVRWVRSSMTDQADGGFYNAQTPSGTDRTRYVDRNAMMAGALIRAAALFDDIWLRDAALRALETVVVPAYKPGQGVAHVAADGRLPPVRALLGDQIHVASALIWAHAATGQLPYSMLAAEVTQFAVREMWDEEAGGFRDRASAEDPLIPFELNCLAARVLARLAILTGDTGHHDRACVVLRSLAAPFRERDLFGASFALAVREVIGRHPPAGLELTSVDWQL